MIFKNKQNGYEEISPCPWLWTLLFGWLYFAYKGAWGAAVLWLITTIASFGIGALVWPFFARGVIRKNYLTKGWEEYSDAF